MSDKGLRDAGVEAALAAVPDDDPDDEMELPGSDDMPETVRERLFNLMRAMKLEFMDPASLAPNDLNPNRHPSRQRRAMAEFMTELEQRSTDANPVTNFVGALTWNKRTGRLIDGHMRQTEALERGEPLVPVLVLDVDEKTENLIVLYLDKIGQMAERAAGVEDQLLDLAEVENEELRRLIADDQIDDPDEPAQKMTKRSEMPEGGLALPLGVKFDYIVLLYRTEIDYIAACDHFGVERQQCPFTGGVGRGRVVDGAQYLARIRKDLNGVDIEVDDDDDVALSKLAESD